MENKQSKKIKIILIQATLGLITLGLLALFFTFPWVGFEAKLFWKGCSGFECFQWKNQIATHKKRLKKRPEVNTNGLARAYLFIEEVFQTKSKLPPNYTNTLKQYARLITTYKNVPKTSENRNNFTKEYSDFLSCYQHMVSYYFLQEREDDLGKLDYFLFENTKQYQNIYDGFFEIKPLGHKDLSDFHGAIFLRDRCLHDVDNIIDHQFYMATKGRKVDIPSIQKDIIKFETRFGHQYRSRYGGLMSIDTGQYIDQTQSL